MDFEKKGDCFLVFILKFMISEDNKEKNETQKTSLTFVLYSFVFYFEIENESLRSLKNVRDDNQVHSLFWTSDTVSCSVQSQCSCSRNCPVIKLQPPIKMLVIPKHFHLNIFFLIFVLSVLNLPITTRSNLFKFSSDDAFFIFFILYFLLSHWNTLISPAGD